MVTGAFNKDLVFNRPAGGVVLVTSSDDLRVNVTPVMISKLRICIDTVRVKGPCELVTGMTHKFDTFDVMLVAGGPEGIHNVTAFLDQSDLLVLSTPLFDGSPEYFHKTTYDSFAVSVEEFVTQAARANEDSIIEQIEDYTQREFMNEDQGPVTATDFVSIRTVISEDLLLWQMDADTTRTFENTDSLIELDEYTIRSFMQEDIFAEPYGEEIDTTVYLADDDTVFHLVLDKTESIYRPWFKPFYGLSLITMYEEAVSEITRVREEISSFTTMFISVLANRPRKRN